MPFTTTMPKALPLEPPFPAGPIFSQAPRLFWQDGKQGHRFGGRNCYPLAIKGQFLGIFERKARRKCPKTAMVKTAVSGFYGSVALSKYLNFPKSESLRQPPRPFVEGQDK